MDKVSIIIPCLNHFDYTKKCLESLVQWTDLTNHEVIIINDGSTDETNTELIKYLDCNYTLIRHWPTNLGFAKSVNDGIKVSKGRYLCICNNDFVFGPDWLEILYNGLLNSDNWYMATGYLVGQETVQFDSFNEWAIEHNKRDLDYWKWCKSGPWLFKVETFHMIGMFDEQFKFGTYEDTDLLMRMTYAKMDWGGLNKGCVYHYGSITQLGELRDRVGNTYMSDNRLKFENKWGSSHITPALLQAIYELPHTHSIKQVREMIVNFRRIKGDI